MQIKLLKLRLRNFKGISDFALDTGGSMNVWVFGDNATGKTTLFDAFLWLLFDKDSANRKDFEIKTLGRDGEPLHGLEHEVEATLELDAGRRITLRKVYKEQWTKRRGSAEKQFTGHTTDYFVNGVPVKKAEYDRQIADIASEDAFKLLTNPTYFNEQLHWQERRRILLEVCGDVTDEDVIASDKRLARLPEILQGRRLEDHRKVIAARMAEINRELDRIPVRIDEVQQGLPTLDGAPEELLADIAKLKAQRAAKQQELARLESGGAVAEKVKMLREVETELLGLQRTWEEALAKERAEAYNEESDLQNQIRALRREADSKREIVAANQRAIDRLEREMADLRSKWNAIHSETFTAPDTCPTCRQILPEAVREEARANFNRSKAERLTEISTRGKAAKAEAENLHNANAALEKEIDAIEQRIVGLEAEVAKVRDRLTSLGKPAAPVSSLSWVALQNQKAQLEREIEALRAGDREAVAAVVREISDLDIALAALERKAAQAEARKRGLERIEELKAEERRLASEYERLEHDLYITEEFIRTKVRLLEDRINSRFQLARFKLFNTQVNGAVVECCETTYQGVPYSGGLNNAARINVGLDIINTLAEHYRFAPPIWIDNAEAVTQLVATKGQMIRLVVSEADKALRVETDSSAAKEVA